jgi:ribosomal protein S18 acetylase RimI-like enzyme
VPDAALRKAAVTDVREADLSDPAQAEALVRIIDSYARGPGGQNAPLPEAARAAMAPGLAAHPAAFALLAWHQGEAVGAAVCVWGFSTFAGRPSLNVHDLAVLPEHQGHGIGRALLEEAERRAHAEGSAKLTLEVHESNEGAKRLYARFGFEGWEEPTLFVAKPLAGAR